MMHLGTKTATASGTAGHHPAGPSPITRHPPPTDRPPTAHLPPNYPSSHRAIEPVAKPSYSPNPIFLLLHNPPGRSPVMRWP
ncbi:hypothetical protein AOQ84DRAFT_52374 [Glonium stellatum]|uniref:Uncharacterized protein n=1 Tax=Glonium stellatum TaxID=574774 RepID=A0A8E2F0T0_9PEZI|nr:hypothetical protein AOQ84DRAFT_52374 [Glonium stellatum]